MNSKYALVPLITLLLIAGTVSGRGQGGTLQKKTGVQPAASQALPGSTEGSMKAMGPLRVLAENPRYFTDGRGKAVLLSGFEFWDVLRFDGKQHREAVSWSDFLNVTKRHGVNFIRLWIWNELTKFRSKPNVPWLTSKEIWMRTGPGMALDGNPKFDLNKFNQTYFDELKERVIQAREKGIYVSIMLFEGWSLRHMEAPWRWDGHPFNVSNNIQGINGDLNSDDEGTEIHTLEIPEVTRYQEKYVKKVIDSVNGLDNVLYEISNEDHSGSKDWQYHIIQYIKNYERTHKAQQHPVWMSVQLSGSDPGIKLNQNLFNSPADCIAPNSGGGYKNDPPASEGRKIMISDSDHICGGILDHSWVWKSFTRGLNVVNYMELSQLVDSDPMHVSARNAMGHILQFSQKIDLAAMSPQEKISSKNYALVKPGSEYLMYLPSSGHRGMGQLDRLGLNKWANWFTRLLGWNEQVKIDLSGAAETFRVAWFNPRTGEAVDGGFVKGGGKKSFTAPFTGDAVLHVYRP